MHKLFSLCILINLLVISFAKSADPDDCEGEIYYFDQYILFQCFIKIHIELITSVCFLNFWLVELNSSSIKKIIYQCVCNFFKILNSFLDFLKHLPKSKSMKFAFHGLKK